MTDETRASSGTEHRSELGDWERAWQRPSRPLRGLIDGYTGYRQRLAVAAVHRGIPGATLPLVISLGPPQTVAAPGGAEPPVTVGSFLAGVHDGHVLIDAETFHGIQVDLLPAAAYRLLGGRPLQELTGRTVPLDALFGADAERLVDDLATAPDWPSRFSRLDRELVRRLGSDVLPHPEVLQAWRRMRVAGGRVRVSELADEVGWSPRHLSARFGAQLGLPPKRMARLVRFERAAALLAGPGRPDLSVVAASAGYYDQAHLTNEVRTFAGLSPGQLLARRLPDEGGVFDLDGR